MTVDDIRAVMRRARSGFKRQPEGLDIALSKVRKAHTDCRKSKTDNHKNKPQPSRPVAQPAAPLDAR